VRTVRRYGVRMMNHNYTYASALATSNRVAWKLDDVIAGRTFDTTQMFLPDSLAGVSKIECLAPAEKQVLNRIRAYTYLYLFGFVEEVIVPFNIDHVRAGAPGDPIETRAILRFTEEEMKHIQLFRWALGTLGSSFNRPVRVVGPASEVAPVILAHSPLGVALTVLCIEWMSQRHYVDSVKDAGLDPLFTRILEHHWIEEAQHAKLDTLMIEKIAGALTPEQIEKGVDDFLAITTLLDGAFAQQIEFDLEALASELGRAFSAAEKREILTAQRKAYRHTFFATGITHPNFDKTLRDLTAAGHARVAKAAKELS
jgi:hypothetical protein